MFTILATKFYIPPPRTRVVPRSRLFERLNEGLRSGRKLTLLSAHAGFGKTTLASEWLATSDRPVAWLSLEAGDNDLPRFLSYLIAAVQTVKPTLGVRLLTALQSPQPPPADSVLTTWLNELVADPQPFILVLDDYHSLESKPIDNALAFVIDHLPPQMHLVIATREDPNLPLARLRAQGQLTEVRAADLRFTPSEAAGFLIQVMGLHLSPDEVAALETRTEGWVAGLQLAAISMQSHPDPASFIKSFTGSHRFVLDYMLEEVLQQQPDALQNFLLHTSILERMCGPLCEAVLLDPSASGQATLESLERANLFIISLDNERRWYRYHHLFAELLRQRLRQSFAASGEADSRLAELHVRASQWYEDNNLEIEAFQHAAAANDIERAEHLIDGRGIPLHLRGAVTMIINWFESLSPAVKNAQPRLWWRHASLLLINGQTTGVEEKLQAAEAAMERVGPNDESDVEVRNFIGQIANARSVLALTRYDSEAMIAQSQLALANLSPNRLFQRANANWTLGYAYLFRRDYVAGRQALAEATALAKAAGDPFTFMLATIGLGNVQESENQLRLAAQTYEQMLQLAGDQPLQIIHEAHLGLARIFYEWNDLDKAEQHAHLGLELARQYDVVIDRFIIGEILLAQLKLARGDVEGASTLLAQTSQTAHQPNFAHRLPEVATAQVLILLRQGSLAAAVELTKTYKLPISQARIHLAQGDPQAALVLLESLRQQAEAKGWHTDRLKLMALEAVARQSLGEKDQAARIIDEVLSLAQPEGYIRTFLDEGEPMVQLMTEADIRGLLPDYTGQLLAAFEAASPRPESVASRVSGSQPLIEPLSQRELEVLQLIAQGLSNREIGDRLFLALSTVKGHVQTIFGKLEVQRRTEAVARARELGLI